MTRRWLRLLGVAWVAVLCTAIFGYAAPAGVKTDKATYRYGEKVRVTFSGAPGLDSDWICVVPASAPDTEGGDYKYMPSGTESGTLAFDPPAPGKYEVRAYYNYHKLGYVVAARAPFAVTEDAAYTKAMEERLERKLDPKDPLEAKVPSGKALVYIVREPWSMSSDVDLEVLCNGKPLVVLGHTDYYPYTATPGELQFKTGNLFAAGTKKTVVAGLAGEATVKAKAGRVYYLRAKVVPLAYYDNYLDSMPHQEGADMIREYKLTIRK